MAEDGSAVWIGLLILFYLGLSISPKLTQSRDYLESIDEKMHTHAADGSINGIRGWY